MLEHICASVYMYNKKECVQIQRQKKRAPKSLIAKIEGTIGNLVLFKIGNSKGSTCIYKCISMCIYNCSYLQWKKETPKPEIRVLLEEIAEVIDGRDTNHVLRLFIFLFCFFFFFPLFLLGFPFLLCNSNSDRTWVSIVFLLFFQSGVYNSKWIPLYSHNS